MTREAERRASWRQVATPDERRLVHKCVAWNIAIYGSALVIAVALAAKTRSPPEASRTAIAASSASTLAGGDQPSR
jgi:hypothetical protein